MAPQVFTWLGLREGHHALSHMNDGNASGVADFCFARELFQYAYASRPTEQTACALGEVQARFRASRLSLDELLLALVRSVHFVRREGADAAPMSMVDAGVPDGGRDAIGRLRAMRLEALTNSPWSFRS